MNDPPSLGSASNKAGTRRPFERHYADTATLSASAEDVFGFVDDFTKLSSHMSRSSAMMMGGSMRTSFDAAHGQAIGSHVSMNGTLLGIELSLEEVVTDFQLPTFPVAPIFCAEFDIRKSREAAPDDDVSR